MSHGKHRRFVPNTKDAVDWGLDWSRDGTRFAYGDFDGGLHVIGSSGRGAVRLASDGHFPRFSPDGKMIVFITKNHGVYLISRTGGIPRRTATGAAAASSSDGRRIAIIGRASSITILDLRSRRRGHVQLPRQICPGLAEHTCDELDWRG